MVPSANVSAWSSLSYSSLAESYFLSSLDGKGRSASTTSNPCFSPFLEEAPAPNPALISFRASLIFCFFSSLMPSICINSSSLNSSSSSSAAALGTRSKSSASSPIFLARRAWRRSSRSFALIRFSCRFCLSVFGIMSHTSSAVIFLFSSFLFLDLLPLAFLRVFFDGRFSSSSSSASFLWSVSISSSSSPASGSSSIAAFEEDFEAAALTACPISANNGLLNHRAVFIGVGSSGNS
mmetsp:Transcript_7911/g.16991  ORF Transcript_7911/g.16991 Transcript_7911/m.16991 type:complete len:237 (-) Transcript_7911:2260-2970(-)